MLSKGNRFSRIAADWSTRLGEIFWPRYGEWEKGEGGRDGRMGGAGGRGIGVPAFPSPGLWYVWAGQKLWRCSIIRTGEGTLNPKP